MRERKRERGGLVRYEPSKDHVESGITDKISNNKKQKNQKNNQNKNKKKMKKKMKKSMKNKKEEITTDKYGNNK